MDNKPVIAALFDFDGVIMDTESQYTVFWDEQGRNYLGEENFGRSIKGQTLAQIFDKHFSGMEHVQEQIRTGLTAFERQMSYEYIPGAREFLEELRSRGVRIALVTSSDTVKMENVYRVHPGMAALFDEILTAEQFKRSKPDPDCFLLGMKLFHSDPRHTYVFEDSFHGLQAGRSSGAVVIGLATTNSRESITGKADAVIDDFTVMTYERMLSIQKK